MTTSVKELRQALGESISAQEQLKADRDTRKEDERHFTTEEQEQFDRMIDHSLGLETQIADQGRIEKSDAIANRARAVPAPSVEPQVVNAGTTSVYDRFKEWARSSNPSGDMIDFTSVDQRAVDDRLAKWVDAYDRQRVDRALSVATATAGGHAVADEPMASITAAQHEYANMIEAADLQTTDKGGPWPWPTLVDTNRTGQYRVEGANRRTNQDPVFGQVVLGAYNVDSDTVLMSEDLLEDFNQDAASQMGTMLGERIAKRINQGATVGSGVAEMQGLLTGGTTATLSFGATATAITPANLYGAEDALNLNVRETESVRWVLSKTAFTAIRTISTNSQQVYQPNLREGAPPRILGYRYILNPDAAAMGTNGNKFGALADMRALKVRMVRGGRLRRLDELYFGSGQVGFNYSVRIDSKVIDPGNDLVVIMANGN